MLLSDFDFDLPPELIAQVPASKRDESRLLTVDRASGRWVHATFPDIENHLTGRPVVVLNDTQVMPAKLRGRLLTSGKEVDLLLVQELGPGQWKVLVKGLNRFKPGMEVVCGNAEEPVLKGVFLERQDGMGVFQMTSAEEGGTKAAMLKLGRPPLPHYIRRDNPDPSLDKLDRDRYQTVFAAHPGAIAAPTAGLHFTGALLESLKKQAEVVFLTLHVGAGTFQPVRTENVAGHVMGKEYYAVPMETWNRIWKAKCEGRKVLAVGTTITRVLESLTFDGPRKSGVTGWTDRFIYPGQSFHVVDQLLTNFHLPRSTLFLLVCAFAGKGLMDQVYADAIRERYRFFSYGDAMLIL